MQLTLILSAAMLSLIHAAPVSTCLYDSDCGPVPGKSSIYTNFTSIQPPWPGNTTGAVLNTTSGAAAPDDLLFQNLLAAEWIIFSFYQQGVERFNTSAFMQAGFPNDTYARIREIRNNEAGHLRIFQNQISSNSIKPGPCRYVFPYTDVASYLALQTVIEVSSMAFLTGLELQAKTTLSRGALVAIASTETRHNTWSLISNWRTDPFAGPSDTFFPFANQILEFTNEWVVNSSCPVQNPVYPDPQQKLTTLSVDNEKTRSIAPGSSLSFQKDGEWLSDTSYYAVFFHGVLNITMPFCPETMTTMVPADLEPTGIYVMVVATEPGAPRAETVVTTPLILLENPEQLGMSIL